MMKMLSKMAQAARVRNKAATMIDAFIFGRITFRSRCHVVAPSTDAASSNTSGTWDSPASRSRAMKGVVFQISERQITNSDDQVCPNQSKVPRWNQELTNPESDAKAYFQA